MIFPPELDHIRIPTGKEREKSNLLKDGTISDNLAQFECASISEKYITVH